MKLQQLIDNITTFLVPAPAYPTAEYPTVLEGVVDGTSLRMESLDGGEFTFETHMFRTFPELWDVFQGVSHNGVAWIFKNAGPFFYQGKTLGISHQQKYSGSGWLKTSPDCYHRWLFWRLQQKDVHGNWLPGTERGLYFRKPFSWRWDVAGTNGKHWIWTNGFIGAHWD